MPKYAALLRGINVGGRNKLAMAELREVVASLGYDGVSTVLQSGNVVFSTPERGVAAITAGLETALAKVVAFPVRVVVLTHSRLAKVISANPLPDATSEPSKFHVAFLDARPSGDGVTALDPESFRDEEVRMGPTEVYVWYRNGVHGSKVTLDLLERRLGVTGTMRNWNTVTKLAALTRG